MVRPFRVEKQQYIRGTLLFVLRHLTSVDPYEDVDTFDIAIALEKSGKLVDARVIPSIADFFIRVIDEIFVRCHFVPVGIPDRSCCARPAVGERVGGAVAWTFWLKRRQIRICLGRDGEAMAVHGRYVECQRADLQSARVLLCFLAVGRDFVMSIFLSVTVRRATFIWHLMGAAVASQMRP